MLFIIYGLKLATINNSLLKYMDFGIFQTLSFIEKMEIAALHLFNQIKIFLRFAMQLLDQYFSHLLCFNSSY